MTRASARVRGTGSLGALAIVLLAALAVATPAQADFRLDPAFGGGDGLASVVLGPGATPSAIDTLDGETYVAGTVSGQFGPLIKVAKLKRDGVLDPEFGQNGVATVGYGKVDSISVRSDRYIAIAGDDPGQSGIAQVFRLDGYGQVDRGWGGRSGVVRLGFGGSGLDAVGADFDAQGRLLVSGGAPGPAQGDRNDVYVARLSENGSLDQTYGGGDGLTSLGTHPAGGAAAGNDFATAIAVLANGSACVSGYYGYDGFHGALYCFASNGTPISTAGGGALDTDITALPGPAKAATVGHYLEGSSRYDGAQYVQGIDARGSLRFSTNGGADTDNLGVAALGADRFAAAGEATIFANDPPRPTLAIFKSSDPTTPLQKSFVFGPGVTGRGIDIAEGPDETLVELLDLTADADNAVTVGRLADDPAFDAPDPTDPTNPEPEEGHLKLGRLGAPRTVNDLLRDGTGLNIRCTRVCEVRLVLRASRRAVKRFDLPSRRLDGYRGRLTNTAAWYARFAVVGKPGDALYLKRRLPAKVLGMRVKVRSVTYSG